MLATIYRFYLTGLTVSALVTFVGLFVWLIFRASRRLDKTREERQMRLYEALLIFLITTPLLSFAVMAILLMLEA